MSSSDQTLQCPECYYEFEHPELIDPQKAVFCLKCSKEFYFEKRVFNYSNQSITYYKSIKKSDYLYPADSPERGHAHHLSSREVVGEAVDSILPYLTSLTTPQQKQVLQRLIEKLGITLDVQVIQSWYMPQDEAESLMKAYAKDELEKELKEMERFVLPNLRLGIDPGNRQQIQRRFKDYLLRFKVFPEKVNYQSMRSMSPKELDFILSIHCIADEKIKERARILRGSN